MQSKAEILKQYGWSDELINHYLVEDDPDIVSALPDIMPSGVYETTSEILSYDTHNSQTQIILNR